MKSAPLRWLLALAVFAPRTIAQAQFEWSATHDGVQAQLADYGRDAAVDSSGNVFVVSEVKLSAASNDANVDINKYSSAGALLWTRRFDVLSSSVDRAMDMGLAPNGDVCVTGYGSAPDYDMFLLRYDTNGNLLSNLSFGGAPGAGVDSGWALEFDSSGNIIVAGGVTDASGQMDMLVKAFTPAGAPLWETRVDSPVHGNDLARDICIDAAGSIFVAGYADSSGAHESAVAKLDSQGQFQWLRRVNLSSPSQLSDEFWSLASDTQGGVIAVGDVYFQTTFPFQTFLNGSAARIDGNGNPVWTASYGGIAYTRGRDVIVDGNGVASVLFVNDFLLTVKTVVQRFSSVGQLLSTFVYDGLAHNGAMPGGFTRGAAGQIFVAGTEGGLSTSPTDPAFLMQQDSAGVINWIRRFPGNGFGPVIGSAVTAPAGRVLLVGTSAPANSDYDALVMQIDVSDAPQAYCVAKVNSLGCTPRIGFTGVSSATATSGFVLAVDRVRNNKPGLFLYSVSGSAATPFGGGTLCLASPVLRTPQIHSGGNAAPANDCSGVYSIDMTAFASGALGGNPNPALSTAGTAVFTQLWGRDQGFAAPNNVTLSNALRYVVLP